MQRIQRCRDACGVLGGRRAGLISGLRVPRSVLAYDSLSGRELCFQVVGKLPGQHLTGTDVLPFDDVDFGNRLRQVRGHRDLTVGRDHDRPSAALSKRHDWARGGEWLSA